MSQFSCLQNGGGRIVARSAFLCCPEDYLLAEGIRGNTWHYFCVPLFYFLKLFQALFCMLETEQR